MRFGSWVVLTLFALAIAAPARGIEVFKRFSLLGDQVPDQCTVTGTESDNPAGDQAGRCVLLSVPPLRDYTDLQLTRVRLNPPAKFDEPSDGADNSAYSLAPNWTAAVAYHHELLFANAANKDVRNRQFSLIASGKDRDVVDMRLSWNLSWSELNLGYQLQSNRASLASAAQSYSLRRMVNDADLDYALTIGITRHFGGPQ